MASEPMSEERFSELSEQFERDRPYHDVGLAGDGASESFEVWDELARLRQRLAAVSAQRDAQERIAKNATSLLCDLEQQLAAAEAERDAAFNEAKEAAAEIARKYALVGELTDSVDASERIEDMIRAMSRTAHPAAPAKEPPCEK